MGTRYECAARLTEGREGGSKVSPALLSDAHYLSSLPEAVPHLAPPLLQSTTIITPQTASSYNRFFLNHFQKVQHTEAWLVWRGVMIVTIWSHQREAPVVRDP